MSRSQALLAHRADADFQHLNRIDSPTLQWLGPTGRRIFAAQHLEHDQQLRAAARAIYDVVYPSEEWTPVPFAEAEKFGTVHYRNAVAAAIMARAQLRGEHARQMVLI